MHSEKEKKTAFTGHPFGLNHNQVPRTSQPDLLNRGLMTALALCLGTQTKSVDGMFRDARLVALYFYATGDERLKRRRQGNSRASFKAAKV